MRRSRQPDGYVFNQLNSKSSSSSRSAWAMLVWAATGCGAGNERPVPTTSNKGNSLMNARPWISRGAVDRRARTAAPLPIPPHPRTGARSPRSSAWARAGARCLRRHSPRDIRPPLWFRSALTAYPGMSRESAMVAKVRRRSWMQNGTPDRRATSSRAKAHGFLSLPLGPSKT